MLDLNSSLLYQLINLWILILILHLLFFKPLMQRITERRNEIKGNLDEAKRREEEVQTAVDDYQAKIAEARRVANEELAEAVRVANETQRSKLDEARQAGTDQVAAARAEIAAESDVVRQQISDEARRLSVVIAEKFLGRTVA